MIADRSCFRNNHSAGDAGHVRIGLALGGGCARGSAHMGVLRTLEDAGIAYDMMSATSIGALAGLVHCVGYRAEYMIEACKRELMPPWWLARVPGGAYVHMMRMMKPSGIATKIKRYLGDDCRLEELPVPLFITATDLITGELVVQDQGCAVTALIASMSIPGIAKPVSDPESGIPRLLVDGGVLNNLPGDVLRERGADIVIGVDISAQPEDTSGWTDGKSPGVLSNMSRSWQLMNQWRNSHELNTCDIVIRPDVTGVGFTAFQQVDRLADAGSAATTAALPRIRSLIEKVAAAKAVLNQPALAVS